MSSAEHASRCRGWIEEQLEALGNLRNAQSRDPSFKLWRQNTVTVLQRVWPDQNDRAERFRRITFSPASSNHDPRAQREWYSRGCVEATNLLRAMIQEIDEVGVPHSREMDVSAVRGDGPGPADDFPVLDLPATGGAKPGATKPEPSDELQLGGTPARAAAPQPASEPDAPAPPRLRVDAPAPPKDVHEAPAIPRAPSAAPNATPAASAPLDITPSVPSEPRTYAPAPEPRSDDDPGPPPGMPERRRTPRAPRTKKMAPRGKLKEMLGLQDFEGTAAKAAPEAPKPAPAAKAEPAEPAAPAAKAAEPPRPAAPAPVTMSAERPKSAPAVPTAKAAEPTKPEPPAPRAAEPPPAPAGEAEAPAEARLDANAFEQATRDFLRNSPVLGLQGRPVQRTSDATVFVEPDAVALATLATDLTRLGVPETEAATLRDELLSLAREIEGGQPTWAAMRAAVADAMAHPALARRLVPVVLPWLERAA